MRLKNTRASLSRSAMTVACAASSGASTFTVIPLREVTASKSSAHSRSVSARLKRFSFSTALLFCTFRNSRISLTSCIRIFVLRSTICNMRRCVPCTVLSSSSCSVGPAMRVSGVRSS